MEGEVYVTTVPEVSMDAPTQPKEPMQNFSGKWEDFAKDMEAIKAEQAATAQPAAAPEPIVEPVAPVKEPEQPQAQAQPTAEPKIEAPATQTPQVPKKFMAPDGTLDQDKLLNSYLEVEKGFKRLQNAPKPVQQTQVQPQTNAPVAAPPQYSPFAVQIEQEAKQFGLGPTLEKLAYALEESAYQRAIGDVQGLKAENEKRTRQEELKAIAKSDPWILTQEGFDTLKTIRETYPHINMAPEPWKEAYEKHLAQTAMKQRLAGPQVAPTPKAPAAPIAPAVAAARQVENPVKLDSPEAIREYVSKLTPEQEKAFWAKSGFRWR